jgi:hypothetical protein
MSGIKRSTIGPKEEADGGHKKSSSRRSEKGHYGWEGD